MNNLVDERQFPLPSNDTRDPVHSSFQFGDRVLNHDQYYSQSQPATRQHTHTDVKSFESFLIYTGHTTPRIIKNNNTEYPYRKGLKNRCAMDK